MLINSETATRPVRGIPFTRFLGNLNRKRLMLVSTAGISPRLTHLSELNDYHHLIQSDTPLNDLYLSHRIIGLEGIEKDLNCVFPIDRLNEIVESGMIMGATTHHICIAGNNLAARGFKNTVGPRVAELVEAEDAGGVVVTAAGVLGHRIAAIVQRAIEDRGIPTVAISQYPRLGRLYNVSRILYPVGFHPGHVTGPPGHPDLQRQVLRDAIGHLVDAKGPLSLLEKTYPNYPLKPVKRRFQLWENSSNWKSSSAL